MIGKGQPASLGYRNKAINERLSNKSIRRAKQNLEITYMETIQKCPFSCSFVLQVRYGGNFDL